MSVSNDITSSSVAIDNILSIFGRTNNESVVKERLDTINDYCKVSVAIPTLLSRGVLFSLKWVPFIAFRFAWLYTGTLLNDHP